MIADCYTKPLQGKAFNQMRDQIMEYSEIPIEECIGNQTENETKSKWTIGTQIKHEQLIIIEDKIENEQKAT